VKTTKSKTEKLEGGPRKKKKRYAGGQNPQKGYQKLNIEGQTFYWTKKGWNVRKRPLRKLPPTPVLVHRGLTGNRRGRGRAWCILKSWGKVCELKIKLTASCQKQEQKRGMN